MRLRSLREERNSQGEGDKISIQSGRKGVERGAGHPIRNLRYGVAGSPDARSAPPNEVGVWQRYCALGDLETCGIASSRGGTVLSLSLLPHNTTCVVPTGRCASSQRKILLSLSLLPCSRHSHRKARRTLHTYCLRILIVVTHLYCSRYFLLVTLALYCCCCPVLRINSHLAVVIHCHMDYAFRRRFMYSVLAEIKTRAQPACNSWCLAMSGP